MASDRAPKLGAAFAAFSILATAQTVLSPSARAEPTSSRRQLARDLMKRGNELRAARDFEGALGAFRAADDIMHVPTTGFEVARSEAQLGQLVEASDALARVARIPAGPDEPQAFKDAREYARLLGVELGPRIPKIRVRLHAAGQARGISDVVVRIDGEVVPMAALDIPYAVDPGKHMIAASATDGRTATQEVVVREGEESEIVLALTSEKSASLPPPPPVARETPPVRAHPAPSDRRPFTWIAFGTAGGAALVGGAAGIVSWARERSASARCSGNQCPPSTYGDIDAAHTFATVSTISFVVAGVAAAAGAVSLLTATHAAQNPHAPAGAGITVWIGLGVAGVRGGF
jgi:hypothetical protein